MCTGCDSWYMAQPGKTKTTLIVLVLAAKSGETELGGDTGLAGCVLCLTLVDSFPRKK